MTYFVLHEVRELTKLEVEYFQPWERRNQM